MKEFLSASEAKKLTENAKKHNIDVFEHLKLRVEASITEACFLKYSHVRFFLEVYENHMLDRLVSHLESKGYEVELYKNMGPPFPVISW